MRSFLTRVSISLVVGSLGGVSSASAAPTRTVLVLDQSGSMDASDRTFLAQTAGMLYLGLAKKHDHVGLVRLGTRGQVVVPLGPVQRVRQDAWAYLHDLDYRDPLTDIGDGLAVALRELTSKPSPGSRDIVILLTDGKVDLGRARAHEVPSEERRIRGSLMQQYAAGGVALYTVAFSEVAEQGFLKALASSTGGQYLFVPDIRVLDRTFTELFVAAADVDSLPERDGGFMVDDRTKKASLVVMKSSADEQVRVVTPDDESLSPDTKRPDINWTRTPAMDTVELDNPTAGRWGVDQPQGSPPPLALVTDSALELKVGLNAKTATLGDTLHVTAELLDEGARIKSFAKLEQVVFSVQLSQPGAEPMTVQLAATEPGLYAAPITPARAGLLQLTVRAVGPALERQRSVEVFLAEPKVPEVARAEPAEEVEADDAESWMVTLGRPLAYMNVPLFLALGFAALTVRVWRKRSSR